MCCTRTAGRHRRRRDDPAGRSRPVAARAPGRRPAPAAWATEPNASTTDATASRSRTTSSTTSRNGPAGGDHLVGRGLEVLDARRRRSSAIGLVVRRLGSLTGLASWSRGRRLPAASPCGAGRR